jgi:hypothetical protein
MIVSLTEFKTDLDRYLELVSEEKIVITKDGENFATLSSSSISPQRDKVALLHSLIGTLPSTVSIEEARAERLARHEAGL